MRNEVIEFNKTQRKDSIKFRAGDVVKVYRKIKEGENGLHGGGRGDLYISVYINKHLIFKRQNSDILCDVPITCVQAILGCNIEIPTIDGKVDMKIPLGTQPGTIFRLREKGVPSLRKGRRRGDQLIRIQVEIPKNLNAHQKQLINDFSALSNDKDSPNSKNFYQKVKKIFG